MKTPYHIPYNETFQTNGMLSYVDSDFALSRISWCIHHNGLSLCRRNAFVSCASLLLFQSRKSFHIDHSSQVLNSDFFSSNLVCLCRLDWEINSMSHRSHLYRTFFWTPSICPLSPCKYWNFKSHWSQWYLLPSCLIKICMFLEDGITWSCKHTLITMKLTHIP